MMASVVEGGIVEVRDRDGLFFGAVRLCGEFLVRATAVRLGF
jgi:hypothetical protein